MTADLDPAIDALWRVTTCTCGSTKPHEIARRTMSDGATVCLWSDGQIAWPMGFVVKGSAHPRTDAGVASALEAGWLVMGEACVYDADELTALITAARWSVKRGRGLRGMRDRFADLERKAARMTPAWEVLSTDRAGKPTRRFWRPARLSPWRRHGLLDEQIRGERFHLVDFMPGTNTFTRSGFSFTTLGAALDFMAANPPEWD